MIAAGVITAALQMLIGEVFALWKWARQDRGLDIPEWDELIGKIDTLQAKIDAEKVQ